MFTVLILKDWATTLGVGKVFIKDNLPYKLQISFNKSLQIYEGNTWISTSPLILNEPYY